MKKILVLILIALSISASWRIIPHASAQTDIQSQIDAITKQRDALLAQQKVLQAQLDQLSNQGKTLSGTVKILESTKKKLANDLKLTQSKIAAANLNIQKLNADITANQASIDTHKKAIASALKELSDYDATPLVYQVLSNDDLASIWKDSANLLSVQDTLNNAIDELRNDQVALKSNVAQKEAQKTNLVSLSVDLTGQKQVVENTQNTQKQLLVQTMSQEAQYQKMLADNIAQEQAFEQQLYQYESQLKASNPNLLPAPVHGELSWPLDSVKVTQLFGRTSSSGRLYASGTHNGVDFKASIGTPVKAVRDGFVRAMGNTDLQRGCYSYGRWVLIQHDDGLSSVYAHLSATVVAQGQKVSAGQTIGYSGGMPGQDGAGYSIGPHLHLGLLATAGIRVDLYTMSTHCKSVIIPLANPKDYLDPMVYLPYY